MNRPTFSRILAGMALRGTSALPLHSAASPRPGQAGTTPAPYKISIMLWTVFRHLPFEERLEKVSEAGYHAVELVNEFRNWSDADYRRVCRKKHELGITFDTAAGLHHGVGNPEASEAFLRTLAPSSPFATSWNALT